MTSVRPHHDQEEREDIADDHDNKIYNDDENDTDSNGEESDGNDKLTEVEPSSNAKTKKVYKLSLAKTEDFNETLRKRGVLYVARIPPKMTPTKIKSLLSEFAEVTRVYLVEEDPTVRKRRKKMHGGSGGKRYVEGWVEFSSKKKAKHIAQSLNNTPISNHKRNPHYGKKTVRRIIFFFSSGSKLFLLLYHVSR